MPRAPFRPPAEGHNAPPRRPVLGGGYRKIWAARAVSNLGDGVTLVAAPLLAAALTRDPVQVAGLSFAQRLPWLLFPLFAGVLADRIDRRLILVATDSFRAALVGAFGLLVLSGHAGLPVMYAVFFLIGAAETLFDLASYAVVPAVVGRDRLEEANGRLYAAELVANQFVGPPLGGLLFGLAAALPFLLDAGTFAAAAALALALRGRFRPDGPRVPGAARPAPSVPLLAEVREGFRWLLGRRPLLVLALMLGTMNAALAAADAVFVLFARDALGLGNVGYGLVVSCAAAGGVVGSLAVGTIVRLVGPGRAILGSVFLGAASQAGVALSGRCSARRR